MSGNSVTLPGLPSVPAKANAWTGTAPAQKQLDSATGTVNTSNGPATTGAAGASVAAEGPTQGQQAAAQSQLSRFTTAKAGAYVILNPGSGARMPKYNPPQCLELGSRGPEVYQAQLQLIRLGDPTQAQVSSSPGVYSEKTCEAVLSFQLKYGLEPNGILGGETFNAMIQVELEEFDRKAAAAREKKAQSSRPAVPRPRPAAQAPPRLAPASVAAPDAKPAPAPPEYRPMAPKTEDKKPAEAAPKAEEKKPAEPAAKPAAKKPDAAAKPALPGDKTPRHKPVDAPTTNAPGSRKGDDYKKVIDQFDVSKNKRYDQHKDGNGNVSTYCNIFLWDVTRAMGAEIPHWVDTKGNPTSVGVGYELDANGTVDWMNNHGTKHGWRKVDEKEAQKTANEGHPSAVLWKNPGGIGHIAVVRPGEITDKGPAMSQSGAQNLNEAHVYDIFQKGAKIEYWVHD